MIWKAEGESFPFRTDPENAELGPRSEYQMHDRIVFIKIVHLLVRPALNITAADIGVFRIIFERNVT
jgi:hypothetical protein